MQTCAFTGHRPESFIFGYDEDNPICMALKIALQREIINAVEKGVTVFYSGVALGVDIWAAEEIINLKRNRKDIRLVGAVPFEGQEKSWTDEQKERYANVIANCDEVVTVSEKRGRGAFLKRDRYMVDNADMVIAVYNRMKANSGTGYTVRYAVGEGRPVVIINPETLDTEEIK